MLALSTVAPRVGARLRRVLVFGASSQIGDGLLDLLQAAACEVVAVSRQPRADADGLRWIRGALEDGLRLPDEEFDAVFSLGPLDAFAHWFVHAGSIAPRVIAFGSTSITTKAASSDPDERDVARRLGAAEEGLFTACASHGQAATILRPTLIYGRARDRTLTRIATWACRRGFFVLPANASGLRQPVHADDLAQAALAAAQAAPARSRSYDLPGGETLRFDAMVARTLACLPGRPRLLRVPTPLFRVGLHAMRQTGRADSVNAAMLARLDADLVFDDGDARRDIGYAPRAFVPDAAMFAS